ncbi:MAG: hypothetical protein HYU36_04440 [Planctomycetes bacterium]|nr:hypothetical protein [Planctomycetota bacterium]MBI3179679.1 hypothetical protein [Deltaproteobacteria bacterium]
MPPNLRHRTSFLTYLKEAFRFHWNLLAFGSGMLFGLVSPAPSVFCPLILAAEVGYLALLSSNPRFQRAIDARYHQPAHRDLEKKSEAAAQHVRTLIETLGSEERQRFEQLQERCRQLRDIARGVSGTTDDPTLSSFETASIDKLLWVFLRLLYSKNAMDRFFRSTDRSGLEASISNLEQRVAGLRQKDNDPRLLKSLEDNLETSRSRLQNYDLVKGNFEFVQVELERIENKINAICEAAINRQDPDYISSQVDSVAHSMTQTEKAMSQLRFLTGLQEEEVTPSFMQEEAIQE